MPAAGPIRTGLKNALQWIYTFDLNARNFGSKYVNLSCSLYWNTSPDANARCGTRQSDIRRWYRILNETGWSMPDWPVDYGRLGWESINSYIFEDEGAAADAPHLAWRADANLVGPVLHSFGTDERLAVSTVTPSFSLGALRG